MCVLPKVSEGNMRSSIVSTIGCTLLFATVGSAQFDVQLRLGRKPGWDPRAREGRCEMRVWVDHQAELRLRGENINVRTLEGSKSYDEGSSCSHPMPYNSVRNFQFHQTGGRNQVSLAQQPSRMNNYTALFAINDEQGGGDHYAFEVTWAADEDVQQAPAAFFDDVRACQETVRQRFLSRNSRGAYVDFEGSAERLGENQGRETIHGRGSARDREASREITYSCLVTPRTGQVQSGDYQYSGDGYSRDNHGRLK